MILIPKNISILFMISKVPFLFFIFLDQFIYFFSSLFCYLIFVSQKGGLYTIFKIKDVENQGKGEEEEEKGASGEPIIIGSVRAKPSYLHSTCLTGFNFNFLSVSGKYSCFFRLINLIFKQRISSFWFYGQWRSTPLKFIFFSLSLFFVSLLRLFC